MDEIKNTVEPQADLVTVAFCNLVKLNSTQSNSLCNLVMSRQMFYKSWPCQKPQLSVDNNEVQSQTKFVPEQRPTHITSPCTVLFHAPVRVADNAKPLTRAAGDEFTLLIFKRRRV